MTREEFNQLFERLYSPLCNYAFAIIKDHDDAEDIVQAIFVDYWNKEDKDSIEVKIDNYLIRAVKFKCIDYQRKIAVKRKHESETVATTNIFEEEQEDHSDQLKDMLHIAIGQLPEKTRQVFMMSKLDGLSYKEIADQLEISPKTVENQMGRAFKHLRELLKDYKNVIMSLIFFWMSGG